MGGGNPFHLPDSLLFQIMIQSHQISAVGLRRIFRDSFPVLQISYKGIDF